jgi:hypothetical protein
MPGTWQDLINDPMSYVWKSRQLDPEDVLDQRQAVNRPYTPEEEQGVLAKLAGGTMTGLGYAAGVLDKTFGGRAIRGVLGGRPRELLSVLPGSDTFGITDPSQRVSGEQLAQHWGLLDGPGEKGTFELRDLVGPGLEAALDPATYLTLGGSAVNRFGKAAEKLGVLPERLAGRVRGFDTTADVAHALGAIPAANARRTMGEAQALGRAAGLSDLNDLVGKPLGGLAGFRVPFTGAAPDVPGWATGPTAGRVADALGGAWDYLATSRVGRQLSSMFQPASQGQTYGPSKTSCTNSTPTPSATRPTPAASPPTRPSRSKGSPARGNCRRTTPAACGVWRSSGRTRW